MALSIFQVSLSHLSVELDGGESLELVADQVRVVRSGDKVVRQRLIQIAVLHWVVLLLPRSLLWRGEIQSRQTASQSRSPEMSIIL